MRSAFWCLLVVTLVLFYSVDSKKSFSTRRKSGGNNRRGQTNHQKPPPPAPVTPQKTDSNTHFLNSERAGSIGSHSGSQGSSNTHYRKNPFDNTPSAPQPPKQVPQTNGPIGFEKLNADVKQRSPSSGVASAPSYPGVQGASYPGKQSAPNGPPPAYPGYGTSGSGTHGGFDHPPAYPGRPVNAPPVYAGNNPQSGYPHQNNYQQSGIPHQQSGFPHQQSGYPHQQSGYPHQQSGYPYQQNGYPNQQSHYPQQPWGHTGQQNFGYPNTGTNFGNYPNQGYNQGFGYPSGGFGGYGNSQMGGFRQSSPWFGGNSFGGSPFGRSNSFGGSPFSSPSFGGFGGNSPYGYRKKSMFGGMGLPILMSIPLLVGGYAMFAGRSYNHRVLDTFMKNQTINNSDNSTAVYILNNSTVTPCVTDQFIYDSLNVTVLSCTADNCTAIKVFTTTNVAGEVSTHSAGITMCLDVNTTYSSFADNINPTVSDLHKYWMKVCKELEGANSTNTNQQADQNATVKFTHTIINETVVSENNQPVEPTPSQSPVESSTTRTPTGSSTPDNTPESPGLCEVFSCSWIEMCLPSVEILDQCATQDCPFTRTGYRPCVTVKMCKSPTTPTSTFATLNTTLSRIDQHNNITSVHDVANLTLISFMPPMMPANCSQDAADPACKPQVDFSQVTNTPQELCPPALPSDAASNNGTACTPAGVSEEAVESGVSETSTETTTTSAR